jgi:DNA-binding NtrC family response regulator
MSAAKAAAAHRILLVEDDSTILQFSVLMLVRAGYQVSAVEGTQAAWEALQSRTYDLLVTDNQMPGMSGLELVSKLRSAQLALPVILASGGIGAEELAQNQRLQPALALPKPFTADQLLETVAEALYRASRDPAHTEVSFPAYGDSYSHWGLNE